MRIIYRAIFVSLFSLCLYFLNIKLEQDVISTLYTVSGIMFSVGISLVISFRLSEITNEQFLQQCSLNLKNIRNNFIIYFFVSTLLYLSSSYLSKLDVKLIIIVDLFLSFISALIFFIIVYFVLNFLEVNKLQEDIAKKIREEKRKSKPPSNEQ